MTPDGTPNAPRPRRRLLAGLLALSFLPGLSPAHAQEAPEVVEVVVPPWTDIRMVDIEAPEFPRSAVQRGMEGWVKFGLTVNEQGKAENIRILGRGEDSAMHRTMERRAADVLEEWQFEPAEVNGEPVPREATQSIHFPLYPGNAVPDAFRETWLEGAEAVKAGNLEAAQEAVEDLERRYLLRNAERLYLAVLQARLARAEGDLEAADELTDRALDIYTPIQQAPALEAELLRNRMELELAQGRYHAALGTYDKLTDHENVDGEDSVHEAAEAARSRLNGDETLVREGAFEVCDTCRDPRPRFHRSLNRTRFSLEFPGGAPSEVRVVCGPARVSLDWQAGRVWALSGKTGTCSVTAYGVEGDRVRLLEPPSEALPRPEPVVQSLTSP